MRAKAGRALQVAEALDFVSKVSNTKITGDTYLLHFV